jgi:hypothetical protein
LVVVEVQRLFEFLTFCQTAGVNLLLWVSALAPPTPELTDSEASTIAFSGPGILAGFTASSGESCSHFLSLSSFGHPSEI